MISPELRLPDRVLAMAHINETGDAVVCAEAPELCPDCSARVQRNTQAYIDSGHVGLPHDVETPFPAFPEMPDD